MLRPGKPLHEILSYYFATRGEKGRALQEVKLIVVGRGGAGKTSLIKRLRGEPFDPYEGETHGINIRQLELACADGQVQAHVWDFGKYVLHAMHEFAEPLLERAVMTFEKALGLEHHDVATCLEICAFCLRAMGRAAEAELLEARARTIRAKRA